MHEREVAEASTTVADDRETIARQAEVIISNVLRGGVLLSASIIAIGVLLFYVHYSLYGADTNLFPHSVGAVFSGIARGDARSVIVLGLIVLLVSPVLRVAVSILTFVLERDWRYGIITTIVLVVLLLSFILGRGGA